MKLPAGISALVPSSKVQDYLLNLEHPVGGGKAKFFLHFGFHSERWEELSEALRIHIEQNPAVETLEDADGVTYVIEGPLQTPSRRRPHVRTVWLLETGKLAPRFITAYPLEQ
jgi:hypothetical protein